MRCKHSLAPRRAEERREVRRNGNAAPKLQVPYSSVFTCHQDREGPGDKVACSHQCKETFSYPYPSQSIKQSWSVFSSNTLAKAVVLLIYVRQMPSLNLGRDTHYRYRFFEVFVSSCKRLLRQYLVIGANCSLHILSDSLFIQSFHAVWSELLGRSLNK